MAWAPSSHLTITPNLHSSRSRYSKTQTWRFQRKSLAWQNDAKQLTNSCCSRTALMRVFNPNVCRPWMAHWHWAVAGLQSQWVCFWSAFSLLCLWQLASILDFPSAYSNFGNLGTSLTPLCFPLCSSILQCCMKRVKSKTHVAGKWCLPNASGIHGLNDIGKASRNQLCQSVKRQKGKS